MISVGTIPEDEAKRKKLEQAWSATVPGMTLLNNHYLSVGDKHVMSSGCGFFSGMAYDSVVTL